MSGFSSGRQLPIKWVMSGSTTEPARTELPRPMDGRNVPWAHEAAAHRRVRDMLQHLPPGFVLFDGLELPRPTRAVVDHLVIGPRNVWAVTTHVAAEPVTFGRGRNADTLWSGATSLRTVLEAADWESAALGDHLGLPVEPVVCIVAPELPEPAFDFHGIRISEPSSIVSQVATSTADFIDVAAAVESVRRSFGVEPAAGMAPPRLGMAILPPLLRPRPSVRRHRTMGARLHAFTSVRAVRVGAAIATVAVLIAWSPTITGLWSSVASESADRITAVIDDEAVADSTPGPSSGAAGVGYVLRCTDVGWVVEWSWPGSLDPGVVGYSVRTRTGGAATLVHTPTTWTDPASPPPDSRLADPSSTRVITEHRAADGSIVATSSELMTVPSSAC